MKKKKVDITPDKTLIKKLGMTGYRTEQAIAELIDNSIDARLDGITEHVKVVLDFARMRITVSDDGRGMDLDELKDALTIAKDPEETDGRLGRFGLGMKSACSNLGKTFSIRTTRTGQGTLVAEYDEEKWLREQDLNWKNFEIGLAGSGNDPGTTITISKLNVPLYPNQMINFRRRFGLRYGPYIRDGQVEITVNSRPCRPSEPDLEEDTKRGISICLPSGNTITGWVGLLKKRSIKGDYGLHIYNRNRLVEAYSKFGMRRHPTTSRFIGEISLDHVPVNFHKTGFLEDTNEYREAKEYFNRDQNVTDLVRSMSSGDSTADDEIRRVLDFGLDPVGVTPLSMKVSAARGKRMLHGMDGTSMESGDAEITVRRKTDRQNTLYETESDSGKTRVTVNASSRVFEAFRNPLFLLGMIKIEAEVFGRLGLSEQAINERNRLWNGFVDAFLPTEKVPAAKQLGPRQEPVSLPYYTLQPELVDLHDYLREAFPHRFQFTGLSTLAPFLHHAHRTLVYNVQAETGTGQELLETIMRHGKGDATLLNDDLVAGRDQSMTARHGKGDMVLLNPGSELLATYLERTEDQFVIVIREHSERLAYAWASPEKAWLDLYMEVESGAVPYTGELVYILDDLLDRNLVKPSKLTTLAKRRGPKTLDRVGRFLPG